MDSAVFFLLSTFSAFGLYVLLAWGRGLIFGQLKVVKVAHGDMAMAGAYLMFALGPVPFLPSVVVLDEPAAALRNDRGRLSSLLVI